jgi:hypothetical protein
MVGVIVAILTIVGAILVAIEGMNKAQNADWRNGLPYCPACGRQISLKSSRPYCRSCGHNLVQPVSRSAAPPGAAKLAVESRSDAVV